MLTSDKTEYKDHIRLLQNNPTELLKYIDQSSKTINNLNEEVNYLKEQLAWFKRQLFGSKSDKIVPLSNTDQPLFDGMEIPEEETEITTESIKSHIRKKRRKKGTGNNFIDYPDDLPVERRVLDLDEGEKIDPATGLPLVHIRDEISRKLAMKEASYYLIEYVRPVYGYPPSSEKKGIKTAYMPDLPIEKCPVDVSIINNVLVSKFADHLPLYRIEERFSREGIRISRQTLCNWVISIGNALAPLYDLMRDAVLSDDTIFIDESPVKLYIKGKSKCRKSYMWVFAGGGGGGSDPPYLVYQFCVDRKYENVEKILKDYKGHMHSDQYGAYARVAANEGVFWVPCMAHIRRKFVDAESGDRQFRKDILRKIKNLFRYERVAWNRSEKERLRIRREKEEAIIDQIIADAKKRLIEGPLVPRSKFRIALEYLLKASPYLKNYINNPDARLENNVAERALRPLTIGRKNWLFIRSQDSGKSTAVVLSLIQTCRNMGINPSEYMKDVMTRIMGHPASRLHELLPDRWAESRKKQTVKELQD